MGDLPPFPRPLGVYPQFRAAKPEALILKERVLSLSGDSFHIKNTEGVDIFQVGGEAFSMSGRKHFADAQGRPLFDIRRELLKIPKRFYGEAPDGKRVFQVQDKITLMKSKQVVTFTDPSTGQEEELLIEGNFLATHAEIKDPKTGAVAARIDRNWLNARQIFAEQQTYALLVAPGVDMALMAALCICLDEKRSENRNS